MKKSSRGVRCLAVTCLLLVGAAVPGAIRAQPFGSYLSLLGGGSHGGVEIPHHPSLNPTGALTIEAWVAISNSPSGEDCRSIVGKNWQQAWWLGLCTVGGEPTLRSYLKGGGSARNGGTIPLGKATHVAVTFDGAQRRHFINGELAGTFAEAPPLTTSTSPMRIGSDVAWGFTPAGAIDEVRLWNVARTQAQLRAAINEPIASAEPGLVAVWALDGNAQDVIGPRDGALFGAGVGFLAPPVAAGCTDTATRLCLQGERFTVEVEWRNPAGLTGPATVVGSSADTGILWFFHPNNWEVMAKVLNGCGINDRYWVFSAATTNVFYRMTVTDVEKGRTKIYFNYPGPPAPAVTDIDAFATCP